MPITLLGNVGWRPAVTDDPGPGMVTLPPSSTAASAGDVILISATGLGTFTDDGGNAYTLIASATHCCVYLAHLASGMSVGFSIYSDGVYAFQAYLITSDLVTGSYAVGSTLEDSITLSSGVTDDELSPMDPYPTVYSDRLMFVACGALSDQDADGTGASPLELGVDAGSGAPNVTFFGQGADQSSADQSSGINYRDLHYAGWGYDAASGAESGCDSLKTFDITILASAVGRSGTVPYSAIIIELELPGATLCPVPPDDDERRRHALALSFDRGVQGRLLVAHASRTGVLNIYRMDDELPEGLAETVGVESADAQTASIRARAAGIWDLFYTQADELKVRVSRDQGRTWGEAALVRSDAEAVTHRWDRAGQRVVVAAYDNTAEAWQVAVGVLGDDGATWEFGSWDAVGGAAKNSANLLPLPDGRVQLHYVDSLGDHAIYECRALPNAGGGVWDDLGFGLGGVTAITVDLDSRRGLFLVGGFTEGATVDLDAWSSDTGDLDNAGEEWELAGNGAAVLADCFRSGQVGFRADGAAEFAGLDATEALTWKRCRAVNGNAMVWS